MVPQQQGPFTKFSEKKPELCWTVVINAQVDSLLQDEDGRSVGWNLNEPAEEEVEVAVSRQLRRAQGQPVVH